MLARALSRATWHTERIVADLMEEGDVWHAGLWAGVLLPLRAVAEAADRMARILNNELPKEVSSGVRQDQEYTSEHQGEMRFVQQSGEGRDDERSDQGHGH